MEPSWQFDVERNRVRPHGTRGIDVSPHADGPAKDLQLLEETHVSHITPMEDKGWMVLFQKGKKVDMGFSVRIREDSNNTVAPLSEFNREGLVSMNHDHL